jgi:membrane protein DedA with SNARE-associated domain
MTEWARSIMESLGYLGIAFLMFLENVFPPIPSEVIMPLAGFSSVSGDLVFMWVVLAGTIGSVLGQLPLYGLGAWYGRERLARWADRHGRWLTVSGNDIHRASEWFEKYGGAAVFLCRFVPGVRTFISIPAGIQRMNLLAFLGYSFVGMGLWAALLAYLGRILGQNYTLVEQYLGPISIVVIGLLLVAGIVTIVYRHRHQSSGDPHENSGSYDRGAYRQTQE